MLTGPLTAFIAGVVVTALAAAWLLARLRRRMRAAEDDARARTAQANDLRTRLAAAQAPAGTQRRADPAAPSAEQRLEDASERFRALLDSLPVPLWVRDADLDVAFANRAAQSAGPLEDAGLARRARSGNAAMTEQAALGGRTLTVTETPVAGWQGTVGFALDAHQTDDTHDTDDTDNGADRAILAGLATGIAVYDADATLRYFNDAYARLFQLEPEWLAARPRLGDVLDRMRAARRLPEVADYRAFRAEQLALVGGLAAPREALVHLPDGMSLRTVVSPHPSGGVVFAYDDLTDRLSLERSVAEADAVARESLDNLHEGVAVFGSDGRLRLGNPAFRRLWGLAGGSAEGLHLADFVEGIRDRLPPAGDWPERKRRITAAILGRRRESGRIVQSDGTVVDYANVPLPDGGVLVSYLDVSDRVRVEQALRDRAEALREADRLKSAFIADVSYEVRTPLTTLQGFAQILADGYFGTLNPRQSEYVEGIVEAGRELGSVIDGILDLASIEAGTMTLQLDAVDVHGLLAAVAGLVRERARHKSLRLEFDCPTGIGWIVCDERRVKQVVLNLLGNAVRFTPARGRIRLAADRDDDTVAISVSDTGPGIAEADQARVFEVFQRGTGPDDEGAGPGLGLALVRRFIELHGGGVEMRSKPGKGTTVTCRLPAKAL